MEVDSAQTWLDDCALLARAFAEFRAALYGRHRSQAEVQDTAARFAAIVDARFRDIDNLCRCDQNTRPPDYELQQGFAAEIATLEKIDAMCILARSGVETIGWWNSMRQHLDDLATGFAASQIRHAQQPAPAESTIMSAVAE